jgi:hypothetical protein
MERKTGSSFARHIHDAIGSPGRIAALWLAVCEIAAPASAQTAFLDLNTARQYSANFSPFAGG